MNAQRFGIRPLVRMSTLAAAALPLLFAATTFAAGRCDAPSGYVDHAACAKAKEGPEALRRFVARTQAQFGLYFWDYMTPPEVDSYHVNHVAQASQEVVASK